jgi:phage tail-like protein
MTRINLPGFWFDNFTTVAASDLFLANRIPEPFDTGHGKLDPIVVEILCTNGNNVAPDETIIYVDSVKAFNGSSGFDNGWTGTKTQLEHGPQRFTDWDMENAGVGDWTVGSSANLSKEAGTATGHGVQLLKVAWGGAPNPYAYEGGVVTLNEKYRVAGYVRGDGTAYPTIQFGGTVVWTGTSSAAWQAFDFEVVSPFTGYAALKSNISSAGHCEWAYVSIRELGPDWRWSLTPPAAFASEKLIAVRVVSEDDGGPADTLEDSYVFTVEDYVKPQLVSAAATYATTIRVVFDEGMQASSPSGANDALNPALYSLAFRPAHDRQAGVSASVTAVSQVDSVTYDLTTNWELSFGKRYQLTCGDIADDSGNLLDSDYRVLEFDAWFPPDWPGTRKFRLWDMLSGRDRREDVSGDLYRLIDCYQDIVDLILWDTDRIPRMWNIGRAEEIHLDAKLQDLGNPHKFPMSVLQKRKLLDILVPSYGQHGTEDAIINLTRFFVGVDVTVLAYNSHEYRWVLGEDELGYSTQLGPRAGTADLYTFAVQALLELTEQQRLWITRIAETAKCAHEHVIILDPTDAIEIDHWDLGLSELGLETILH